MDVHTLWQAALGEIEVAISRANFITWFKNTAITAIDDDCVVISTPNGFAKEWIEQKCAEIVITALKNHEPKITRIRCVLSTVSPQTSSFNRSLDVQRPKHFVQHHELIPQPTRHHPASPQHNSPKSAPLHTHLNPRYTFESFVVGQHNELAHAACRTVSESLGTAYNPLFIYGGVGLGKTHLLQSIGNAVLAKDATKNVLYTSSERFTSELIDSIHNNTVSEFKRSYQHIDLLIIDDVQFLAGKEKTQDEFFHIFNFLYQQNKQIIISSDRPPHEIATLEDRLRSRFEGGMIADIGQPDFETRVAILQRKADERNIILPEDAARFIAKNIATNVRELEGALNKVAAMCAFQHKIPSLTLVEEILSPIFSTKRPSVTVTSILTTVCTSYTVSIEELIGKIRKKSIVLPRQIAMYLMREELSLSYPEIGSHCGKRDHTTVLYACRKIEKMLQRDPSLREKIDTIRGLLRNM